jgi:hypothetical protein
MFGQGGIDFKCNPPNPLTTNSNFLTIEGCSSISDSLGNLLFYTDGLNVYNSQNQRMPNGYNIGVDTTCGGSSTQGALIVKEPLQDSIYYIFTTDCKEDSLKAGFCYAIVNMKLNGGLGDVIIKKQKLLNKVCEKQAAVRHANGIDVWIMTREWGNNKFEAYLLSNSGLNTSPITSATGGNQLPSDTTSSPGVYPECASQGYMKFSVQGNQLALVTSSDCYSFVAYPEIYSFNNSTGSVSYKYTINTNDSTNYYGVSFSPNGNLLYLSGGWWGRYIHQFDLSSNDSTTVVASKYVVYLDTTYIISNSPSALQIAPNNKIYNACNSPYYINLINNPNVSGSGSNFQLNGFIMSDTTCNLSLAQDGLPNNDESLYLNPYTGTSCAPVTIADFSYQDSCINTSIQFIDHSNFYPLAINDWLWDFGDPLSGSLNNSYLKNPQHTFSNMGPYQVKMIAYSDTFYYCKKDSITKTLHITCVAGIHQFESFNSSVCIYPNPNNGSFVIESNSQANQTMQLYDINGRLILSQIINGKTNIDARSLNKGVYNISIISNESVVNKRLVIVK